MDHTPSTNRYSNSALYKRCGRSGLKLPRLSLGMWHNFGGTDSYDNARLLVLRAFDLGITHFDLANNYGPPPGSAESNFGKILKEGLGKYRDELLISTKAGYFMWDGPYGDFGSRKYLISSLDQSLARMGIDYVDIFYHHRPDPDTPLEETLSALDHVVRAGKALYVGISSYSPEQTDRAAEILKELGTPCLIHQPIYNMFNRGIEEGLLPVLKKQGMGCIPFCPLAQGLLTNRYLTDIPGDSRIAKGSQFLTSSSITPDKRETIQRLNELAGQRGQSLAQFALVWVLRYPEITSALIGASKVSQIEDNLAALDNPDLSDEEIRLVDQILADGDGPAKS